MAYIQFSIESIDTILKKQRIVIHFTHEVDEDTVSTESIIVANKETHEVMDFDAVVDQKDVFINLRKAPKVNSIYTLIVQDSVENIVGERLESSLFRKVLFESDVTSTISVLSPASFEVIKTPVLKWEEHGDNPTRLYRIQIAKENAFYNIVYDSVVEGKNEYELADLPDGQYYLHIRSEQGEEYGDWSEVRTFVIRGNINAAPKEDDEPVAPPLAVVDDNTGIVIEDLTKETPLVTQLKMTAQPDNGLTLPSFTFMFDDDINPEGIEVSVIRSDF